MRLEQIDVMDRLGALLARMSKREKALAAQQIDRLAVDMNPEPVAAQSLATPQERKMEVRRQAAQLMARRGGGHTALRLSEPLTPAPDVQENSA